MSTELASFDWKAHYDTDDSFKEVIDSICHGVLNNLPEWSSRIDSGPKNPLRSMPMLNDIPMLCKGTECAFAPKCEVIRSLKDKPAEIVKLIGTDCRVEQVLIPKFFTEYLQLLQIKPADIGDILEVANLVSLIIHRRRIELDISINSINERTAIGVSQGREVFQRQNNPSYKLMESVNKQIAAIEGQLATSRKDRMSMENKNVDAVAAWLEKVSNKLPKKQSNIISTQQANDILTED